MADRYERFVRPGLPSERAAEVAEVDRVASALAEFMSVNRALIDGLHVHNASSQAIEAVLADYLRGVGFVAQEVMRLRPSLEVRPRPDFVLHLPSGRGVVLEVERGGTTTNNHDLKDVWKTHLAPDLHHLFLVVPVRNWTKAGGGREWVFPTVVRRIGTFFEPEVQPIDVLTAHVFAYGGDVPPAAVVR